MGVHAHSVTAAVDPKVVWQRWTDTDLWPEDDASLVKAKLNGPVAQGALGMVRNKKGGRASFRIAEVDRQRMRFVTETKLPLATLTIERELTRPEAPASPGPDAARPDPNLRVLTHRIIIRGRLSRVWDRLLGRRMAAGLPQVVAKVVAASAIETSG